MICDFLDFNNFFVKCRYCQANDCFSSIYKICNKFVSIARKRSLFFGPTSFQCNLSAKYCRTVITASVIRSLGLRFLVNAKVAKFSICLYSIACFVKRLSLSRVSLTEFWDKVAKYAINFDKDVL